MKYILFQIEMKGNNFLLEAVVFPSRWVHVDVAASLMSMLKSEYKAKDVFPVRAGDYCPMSGETSGESTTLGLKSDPEDKRDILMSDYGVAHT